MNAPLAADDLGEFGRVALLADVRGNVAALRAALGDVARAGVDAICFLGGLTWGPEPRAVVELAATTAVPAFFLRGSGERAVLDLAGGLREPQSPVDEWMVDAHGAAVSLLRSFPPALTLRAGTGPARLCHGSPRSDIEPLIPATPASRVEAACAGIAEATVVHGRTHVQYVREVGGRRIAGCGSVGLPCREGPPGARWTLLAADLEPRCTSYDVGAAAAAVRAGGYPDRDRYANLLLRAHETYGARPR